MFDLKNLTNFDPTKIDLSAFDVRNIDLPKFDMRNIDLPKFDLPKFDLPKFDMPKFDMPDLDVDMPAEAERVADFARDTVYVGIGAVVMTAQKADERARGLADEVTTQVRKLVDAVS